jgi:uncharacterized protein
LIKVTRVSVTLFALFASYAGGDEEASSRLFAAVSDNDVSAVKKLLAVEPRLAAATDGSGRSIVMAALFRIEGEGFVPPGKNAVLQTVLAQNPPLTFFEACAVGDFGQVARALRENPQLASQWNDFGWSALDLAAFSGRTETVLLLIESGADVNARARTKFKNTPLQVALLPGQFDTAKTLLEHGADPLVRQAHGFSPIMQAALLGRRDLVDLLLEHGAELNSRADDGRNAVTEALRARHPELASYLKSRGGKDAVLTANLAKPPE